MKRQFSQKKKKQGKYHSLALNMALFTVGSFGSKAIVFFMVPLYTYALSTEAYGVIDLVSSTTALLIPVLTVNIQDAVMRFVLDREYDSKDVICTGFRVIAYGTAALAGALLFLKATGLLKMEAGLILFFFFSFLLGALNNCLSLYLKGKEKVSALAAGGLIHSFFMCLLNIVLLLKLRMGLTGYMIANIASLAIAVCFQFFAGEVYKDLKLTGYRNLSKDMTRYSRPLILNSVAWWVNSASDRYALAFFKGVTANGVYSVSYKIPAILSVVQGVFNNAWSISSITEFDPDDKDGFIGTIYGVYAWISLLACSAIMILNIPIAKLLYAKDFFAAWEYVPFLLAGTMFNGMALFEGSLFIAAKETKAVSVSTLAGAVVNTAGNVILIYFFGTQGAAFATLLGYLATWMMRTALLRGIVRMKLNWNRHFASCAILVFQSFLALRANLWACQIFIFLVLAVLQRQYMKIFALKLKRMLCRG